MPKCPDCQTEIQEGDKHCTGCGLVLNVVPPTPPPGQPPEQAQPPVATPPTSTPSTATSTKTCPHCSASNEGDANMCTSCGRSLSAPQTPQFRLVNEDDNREKPYHTINASIGRDDFIEWAPGEKGEGDMHISRLQMEISKEGGEFYIKHKGVNPTKVNDQQLTEEKQPLKDGDKIDVAGGRVVIRFRTSQ